MQLPLADDFLNVTPTQWVLLFAGVALIFSVRRWRMNVLAKQKRQAANVPRAFAGSDSSSTSPSPPTTSSYTALNVRTVTTEIQSLLADVEETARRVAAQIDNRRSRLEQLLAEADEKIQRLESLTSAAAPATPVAAVQRDASQTLSRLRQERGAPPVNEDPAYRPVYQLADQGKSPREIGQALNRQPGEIELILALRNRQSA
jgi:hypothetical protein